MNTNAQKRRFVLIAGPTASGKSALALKLAKRDDAIIVNADSMQVYRHLRLITARPDDDEERQVPHHLYGHIHPSTAYSTGQWLRDVSTLLGDIGSEKRVIFVGGTGLYFKALLQGLSPMPAVPEAVRTRWRYRLNEEGASRLHRLLRARDPLAAMRIKPGDGQRIVRALEVLEVSGKPISHWQDNRQNGLLDAAQCQKFVLVPPRQLLVARIEKRLHTMVAQGAIEEVEAFLALKLDPQLPAMKAIGVSEFGRYLKGEISQSEAIDLAAIASRQYAKRQATWFRNQFDDEWIKLESAENDA